MIEVDYANRTVNANTSFQFKRKSDLSSHRFIKPAFRALIERAGIIGAIEQHDRFRDYRRTNSADARDLTLWESILGNRRISEKRRREASEEERRRENFALQVLRTSFPSLSSQDGHFLRSQSTIIGYCAELFSPVPHGNQPKPLESFPCLLARHSSFLILFSGFWSLQADTKDVDLQETSRITEFIRRQINTTLRCFS